MEERTIIYKCDPAKNIHCAKTICQKECFYTKDKAFSLDGKSYTYSEDGQEIVEA